jgi:hypothetical protein
VQDKVEMVRISNNCQCGYAAWVVAWCLWIENSYLKQKWSSDYHKPHLWFWTKSLIYITMIYEYTSICVWK